jgi:hypothetical protein
MPVFNTRYSVLSDVDGSLNAERELRDLSSSSAA